MERKIHWRYYITAGLITLVVFSLGIYLSFYLDKGKVTGLEESIREMRITQEDTELEMSAIGLMGRKSCSVLLGQINRIVPKATELGEKLEFYEARERFQDPSYPLLKKEYTLTLIKHWLFVKTSKEECGYDYVPILYFYSNRDCADCIRQGSILSYLKGQNADKIMVFAIDSDQQMNTIALLKEVYNVTSAPSIVIEDIMHPGLKSLYDMKALLNITS